MAAENKDELIIAALISNPTVKAAAAACGVSETAIYDRLRKDEFKKRYAEARYQLIEQSTAFMQGLVGEATAKMRDIMNDPNAAPQVQLNAADSILRNSFKLTEQTDILTRLDALERAYK